MNSMNRQMSANGAIKTSYSMSLKEDIYAPRKAVEEFLLWTKMWWLTDWGDVVRFGSK